MKVQIRLASSPRNRGKMSWGDSEGDSPEGSRSEEGGGGREAKGKEGEEGGGGWDARDLSAMEGWLAAEGVKQGGVGRRTESRGWAPM